MDFNSQKNNSKIKSFEIYIYVIFYLLHETSSEFNTLFYLLRDTSSELNAAVYYEESFCLVKIRKGIMKDVNVKKSYFK